MAFYLQMRSLYPNSADGTAIVHLLYEQLPVVQDVLHGLSPVDDAAGEEGVKFLVRRTEGRLDVVLQRVHEVRPLDAELVRRLDVHLDLTDRHVKSSRKSLHYPINYFFGSEVWKSYF